MSVFSRLLGSIWHHLTYQAPELASPSAPASPSIPDLTCPSVSSPESSSGTQPVSSWTLFWQCRYVPGVLSPLCSSTLQKPKLGPSCSFSVFALLPNFYLLFVPSFLFSFCFLSSLKWESAIHQPYEYVFILYWDTEKGSLKTRVLKPQEMRSLWTGS